jgi:hypothetical protein
MTDYLSKAEVTEIIGTKITGVKQDDSAVVELALDNGMSVVINFYPECQSIHVSEPGSKGGSQMKRKKKLARR